MAQVTDLWLWSGPRLLRRRALPTLRHLAHWPRRLNLTVRDTRTAPLVSALVDAQLIDPDRRDAAVSVVERVLGAHSTGDGLGEESVR